MQNQHPDDPWQRQSLNNQPIQGRQPSEPLPSNTQWGQQPPYQQPISPGQFQPPPPQQRSGGFRQWIRTRRRRTKFALGCGTLFLVLLMCTCSLAAYGSTLPKPKTSSTPTTSVANNSGGQSTPITQATQAPTVQPTATPSPTPSPIPTATATPSPIPSPTPSPTPSTNTGAAVLGGSLNAFIAKFGQPNDHSDPGMPHFKRCSNSNIDQIILMQENDSSSGLIVSILAAGCTSTSWTTQFANAYCSTLLPSDAKYQRSVQIPGSSTQFASVDKIYSSATLAKAFTADNFTDVNGNLVQPGLFDVDYLYASNADTSHVDSCNLQLGTQQTQG